MEPTGVLPVWEPYLTVLPAEAAPSLAPLLDGIFALLGPPRAAPAGQTLVALFDAGPGQIGTPRIAQTAAWLALARRAAEAGTQFAWGILQDPEAALYLGFSKDGFRRLLGSRTPREAVDAQFAAWRSRLEERRDLAEIWMVAAPRLGLPPAVPGAAWLQISDAFEPGSRRVGVTLRRGDGGASERLFEPPDEVASVRLLRAAGPPRPIEDAPLSDPLPLEIADARETRAGAPEPEPAGPLPRHGGREALGARFATAVHRLTGRTAFASRLSRAVSRHHAAYIAKLREMFESGDFDGVLSHAMPLTEGGPRRIPLRSFPPRQDLTLRPERSRPRSAAGLSPEMNSELRRLYREAVQRLESQEKIEEAAFLLAEVLHAYEEAVAFLERHGRLRLAAEMAEARELPPGLVVRQWFLAGDRDRALRIARHTGTFSDAATRLERSRKTEEAAELRRLWARGLADAGDYAAAVDTLWPLVAERHQTLAWMDRAIEQGGAPAGRMLARKLVLAAEPFEKLRGAALGLLESWRAEGAAARLAFAETLVQGAQTPEAMTLARAAVRAVVRDAGRLGTRLEPGGFRQLVAFTGDGAVRADAPALPLAAREPWTSRGEPWWAEVAARDVGAMPAHDAAFLPNGLLVVALGEAGVRLFSRGGRVVAEFDQPAHRLVISDHGDRALALAKRGDVWRIARLDFSTRRGEHWCDAALEAFAPDYDGALWFVATPRELLVAEVSAPSLDGSWGLSQLPGRVLTIARSAARCSILFAGEEAEIWTYELPSLTLRRREIAPAGFGARRPLPPALCPDGAVAAPLPGAPGRNPSVRVFEEGLAEIPLPGPGRLGEPAIFRDWIAQAVHEPDAGVVYLIHKPTGNVLGEFALGRAGRISLRLTGQSLTVADDRGRVLVLDLEYGQVRRDMRL
ncbi:MAG TPA: hypothetical protein VF789_20535 [Thermoanaerobaculia bacterium]